MPTARIDRSRTVAKMRIIADMDIVETDVCVFTDDDIVEVVRMASERFGFNPDDVLSYENEEQS